MPKKFLTFFPSLKIRASEIVKPCPASRTARSPPAEGEERSSCEETERGAAFLTRMKIGRNGGSVSPTHDGRSRNIDSIKTKIGTKRFPPPTPWLRCLTNKHFFYRNPQLSVQPAASSCPIIPSSRLRKDLPSLFFSLPPRAPIFTSLQFRFINFLCTSVYFFLDSDFLSVGQTGQKKTRCVV